MNARELAKKIEIDNPQAEYAGSDTAVVIYDCGCLARSSLETTDDFVGNWLLCEYHRGYADGHDATATNTAAWLTYIAAR